MAIVIGGGSGNAISINTSVGSTGNLIVSTGTTSLWSSTMTSELTYLSTQRSDPSFTPYSSVVTNRLTTSYDIYDISFSPDVAAFSGSLGKIEKMVHNVSTVAAVTNTTGVTNSIFSSFYWTGTNKFYFATTSGRILVSDGSSLNSVSLITLPGSAQGVEGFVAANNRLFACQDNAYLCHSTDGTTWTQVRMPSLTSNYVGGVAYIGSTYYVITLNSQYVSVYSSTDLVTFTEFRNSFGTTQTYMTPTRFKDLQFNSLFNRWECVGAGSFYTQTGSNGPDFSYYYPSVNVFQQGSGEFLSPGAVNRGYSPPGGCKYGRVFVSSELTFFDSDGSSSTNKSTFDAYLNYHSDPHGFRYTKIPIFTNTNISSIYCCNYNSYTDEIFIAGNVGYVAKAKLTPIVNSNH